MPAKKVMPKGGRKPSKTLWAMVHVLTEEEWQMVAAFALMYFKETLQSDLLTLLRSMEVYDPVAEKAAFSDNDLKSLRKTTKRWLIRTVSKLAFYKTEVSEQVLDLDVLLRWGIHDDTLKFIAETKQLAKEQEEFGWLALLYERELKAVKVIFEGDERTKRVVTISDEANENAKLMQLGFEIERQSALYLETARTRLLADGKFDEAYTETYYRSKFYRQNIEAWPISFQIQKLRIDEGLHYFLGRTAEAAKAAEKLLELIERLERIRHSHNEDHARCLFRLSAYYVALAKKQKVIDVIDVIKERAMLNSSIRFTYLRRVAYSLFNAAFEFDIPEMEEEGLAAWNENKAVLNSLSKDVVLYQTYLLVSFQYVSNGNTKAARDVFTLASQISDSFPYFTHQAVFRILHLMILVDEDDERGLQSYGKRYKRHLRAYLKDEAYSTVAVAAVEFVMILAKASNLEGKEKLQKWIGQLLEKLHVYRQSDDTTFNPFIYPMIKWAELRIRP